MEVRFEALEGQTVPQETYLSLRIGAIQKQSRIGPNSGNRTFHFPEPKDGSKADFGRIEVYKKIGHCQVPLAGLDEFPRDLHIECDDASLETLGLRIEIGREGLSAAQDRVSAKVKRKKEKLDEAQKYIADHNLEELLAASLRDVMRKQPGDPASFLSGQIMEKKSMKPTLPPLSEKKGKSKNANRSQSEPRKVASPTKSRPAAPPRVPSLAPPVDEPPAAIPPKALSRSASWCGSGHGPLTQESPKANPASTPVRQPRLERAAPDFRSAPSEFWGALHGRFLRAQPRREAPHISLGSLSASASRQAADRALAGREHAGAPPKVASPAADVLEAEPKLSAQVGGPLSPSGQAQQIPLDSGYGQSSPTARFTPSPAGHSVTSGSTGSLALARSYPLPQPPQELLRTLQPPLSQSSPYPMSAARPAAPIVRPPGGKADPGYIQDLKGAISAKEAKLRALAAQLQELSRLQQTHAQ